jgi:glycosyltransferase involved in cell wall biosynthesis
VKIGLIIYGSLNTVSGGYRYDRMLVHALRSAGHTVEVLALPWRTYPAHLTDNARMLWAHAITRRGYDLLLQDELNHPSLCLLTRYWHWSLDCPQIAIVHHLRSSEQHATWQLPIYRAVERLYLRGVDGFIFNSHTTARSVRALADVERPEHIAYPAADHILPPPRSAIAARLARRAAAGGPLRVIFVGNVIPRKGLHHLLAGLAKLPLTAWTLDIVGQRSADPAYTASLRAAIDAYGLASRVGWHGRVRDALLRQRLAEADVLAVPSYEGFGIVYLEAMAHGLPVLAADIGAAWEIVTHGVDGFLITPGDAAALAASLQSLAEDPARLNAMSLAARTRYDRHGTWASTMSCCEQWLREAYKH